MLRKAELANLRSCLADCQQSHFVPLTSHECIKQIHARHVVPVRVPESGKLAPGFFPDFPRCFEDWFT